MKDANLPLIVGAGPVGLSAALLLARKGHRTRIVDKLDEPSAESRALAVNPRTLEILEPTGVTERILEAGLRLHGACLHQDGKIAGRLDFADIHPKYPFMTALSQATTERLLTEALAAAGGHVERSVRLVECRNIDGGAEAALEPAGDGARDMVRCPWILAADGAHSTVRERLGVGFDGSSFAEKWHLADVPLDTDLPQDHAHLVFQRDGGFQVLIRVVDGNRGDLPAPLWRVIDNRPDPLSHLTLAKPAGPPVWTSAFGISHRIATPMMLGAVFFAGDAAHIHSPVGARGMNLGIEDAWAFAELVERDDMLLYERVRRPIDHQVVRRVRSLSKLAAGETAVHRFLRQVALPRAMKHPYVSSRMMATVTGLDHDQRWGLMSRPH